MTTRSDRRPERGADAKRRGGRSRKSGFGGTLLGLFVGIALGLGLAAGVAYYLTRAGNPYQPSGSARESSRDAAKETIKAGKAEPGAPEKPRFDFYKILPGGEEPKVQAKAAERASSDRATAERAASPEKAEAKAGGRPEKSDAKSLAKPDAKASTGTDERGGTPGPDRQAKSAERFWLQAGSFANEADAESLKARLAFSGWEATIQAATIPDKGVRYRVRVGPYDNTDQLQRMKADLAARGFDAAVIKF